MPELEWLSGYTQPAASPPASPSGGGRPPASRPPTRGPSRLGRAAGADDAAVAANPGGSEADSDGRPFSSASEGRAPTTVAGAKAAATEEAIAAVVVAQVRGPVAEEVADRVAAVETASAGGMVLALDRRREIADQVITEVLEGFAARELAAGRPMVAPAVEPRVRRALLDLLFGLGGLQPLLDDASIETITINGCDEVFVRYADGDRERVGAVADTDEALVELVRQLAARSGVQERRFDPGSPMLDLQLPDGSRLHAVMAVCRRPGVSIRRHRHRRATLEQLRELGTVDSVIAAVLAAAVRARFNILVAGGMGVGKTTMVIALAAEIEPWEHLVTIEDAFELGLDTDPERHPDVKALQAREPNTEGAGQVTQSDLVRAALRQAADRVIVGEIRGPEVVSVCNVMSQGNDGSMATIHASSAHGVFTKLAAYAAQGPERLSMEATALLVASSVNLVVHLDWSTTGHRVVSGIREVVGADGQHVVSNEIFAPDPDRRARPAAPMRTDTLDRLVAVGLDPTVLLTPGLSWNDGIHDSAHPHRSGRPPSVEERSGSYQGGRRGR